MEYAVAVIALAVIVSVVVSVPLRRRGEEERREEARIDELRAAKEAKYREIRDAELDHRMGKLSDADWRAVDRELRGEAIEILQELDQLEGRAPEETGRRPEQRERLKRGAPRDEREPEESGRSAEAGRSRGSPLP
jgi:heme exporter protein D